MAELYIIEVCHRWNAGPGGRDEPHTVALGPFADEATATEISTRARVKLKSLSGDVCPLQPPGSGARGRWVLGGFPMDENGGVNFFDIEQWFGPFENEAAARDWNERRARGRWVLGGFPMDENGGVNFFDIEQWFGPSENEAAARDWNERNDKLGAERIVPLLTKLDRQIVERLYSPEGWRGTSRG